MYVYKQAEIYEIDQRTVEQGFSLYALMENAGQVLFTEMKHLLGHEMRILILAGTGNNGGDGIVLARYLQHAGYTVDLTFPCGDPKTEVAQQHLTYYLAQDFTLAQFAREATYDVVIDCLLGIGTVLPLSAQLEGIVTWANEQAALRIAVDLPTGTVADQGTVGEAFRADYTFSLHGLKPSAFLLPASRYYGDSLPVAIGLAQTSATTVITEDAVRASFPKRASSAHKGTFGTSLLVAGSDAMPGSALLAALGAMRSGTGKLLLATSAAAAQVIAGRVPEATYLFDGLAKVGAGELAEPIAAAAIGPGISDQLAAKQATERLIQYNVPLVLDAGALDPTLDYRQLAAVSSAPLILTPHPGEFSRLINTPVADIQANRLTLAQAFAQTYQVTLVLKGEATVIAFPCGEVSINPTGNSGLAKGGSGDVLTGMLVSMLTTHADYRDAVRNAVYLHGRCADRWQAQFSETSMVASDFNTLLPVVLREIEAPQG